MGNILAFRPRKSSAAKAPKRSASPATVIIFPGVRYERVEGGKKWSPITWIGQPRPVPTT